MEIKKHRDINQPSMAKLGQIQTQMAQIPMLRVEMCVRALRASLHAKRDAYLLWFALPEDHGGGRDTLRGAPLSFFFSINSVK